MSRKSTFEVDRARFYSDAEAGRRFAMTALRGRFRWSAGHDWVRWNGQRWAPAHEVEVTEAARLWVLAEHEQVLTAVKQGKAEGADLAHLVTLMSRAKLASLVRVAQGTPEVITDAAAFDANPDLLNTPAGVVDLRTGEVADHHPDWLMTKITSGSYRPGETHADWTTALGALDPPEQKYLQARLGQAVTGHPTPDGVMVLLQGSGENGKSALTTDGPIVALGDYADAASAKLITAGRGTEHSTEMADLQGQRLLVAEEMTEGRALDVGVLKRIQDVGSIRARRMYRDNVTFRASHSLFITSNYRPVVSEVDHGTWRRLALLQFRRTYRKADEPLQHPDDRRGDPGLKTRIKTDETGQHDAIVTWLVEGAIRVHKHGADALAPTARVVADTRSWRRDADRVLGVWDELLIPDPRFCVVATELHSAVTEWLVGNGHKPWPRETFTGRFTDHAETRRHGIECRQLAVDRHSTTGSVALYEDAFGSRSPIVRSSGKAWWVHAAPRILPMAPAPSAKRPRVWIGVRWRTDADAPTDS